jgi:hypothetical protein
MFSARNGFSTFYFWLGSANVGALGLGTEARPSFPLVTFLKPSSPTWTPPSTVSSLSGGNRAEH